MAKVAISESVRFMVDCFKAVGVMAKPAEQQACLLIRADMSGHPSHGLNRLEFYINDIKKGICKPNNQPKILKETVSTAWIDAKDIFGSTASHFSMNIATQKATTTGVGWVTVKGSNHNGMLGYWSKIAADRGMIGLSFTNTSPFMVPTRSKQVSLGTNPLSVVAPGCDGEQFYLDMATTTCAVGKIEMQRRKGEPIVKGWALDPNGNFITDPKEALKHRRLTPLGGLEETSGFKGYGLAAMVEVFCGISSGSKYGHHLQPWGKGTGPNDIGHCFVAVDPANFAPGFEERMTDCIRHWRSLDPVDPSKPVLALGDREKEFVKKSEDCGFVTYIEQQITSSAKLAEKLNVKPLETMC